MTPLRSLAVAAALALVPVTLPAQTNGHTGGNGTGTLQPQGKVVGRILDASHGTPLSGAIVSIPGSALQTSSAVDGRYTLLNVPADAAIQIAVKRIGYQPKTVSEVVVPAGGGVEQDVALTAEVFQLDAITVSAVAERGAVSSALEEVRNAPAILNSLPAELIRRTPDGDAGQAVQRVAGVTVQDGKYVFVRGLGERYTTTALNGARIPSPEPEKKVVPLDLFPSGLLDGITTTKTFTPDQPGDFSGAQVNLKTREFPLSRVVSISTSVGMNDAATGKPVLQAPTLGREWLGVAGTGRKLPAIFESYQNLNGMTPSVMNQMIGSFRNSWTANAGRGSPNGGLSLSVGGEDPVFGRPIGYIGSFTYSYGQEIRAGERRAVWGPNGVPENSYRGETARSSVTWGGLFNLSSRIGTTSKITLNNTLTSSGDNEASRVSGFHDSFVQQLDLTRLTFTERTVRSNRLAGAHLFGLRHHLDWSATSSAVRRREPDRSDLVYLAQIDSASWTVKPVEWFGAPRSATRTFSDIKEHIEEGGASYRLALGDPARQASVKIGGLAKLVSRDADTRAYDITTTQLTQAEKRSTPDQIFSGAYAQAGRLFLQVNGSLGRYDATDELYAGYLQLEFPLSEAVRMIGGARMEHSRIRVNSHTIDLGVSPAKLRNTDVLPSVALAIKVGSRQNIRLSGSQTLSRPEYRELSPTTYFDILGGQKLFGNPRLKRALVQNVDARWEWYPGQGQTVSLAAFAKRFQRPIERVLQATSDANAPDATFDNAKSARNYGVEIEFRHSLAPFGRALAPFTLFANTTLMESHISLDSTRNPTNPDRAMVGQSEYVLNVGLGFSPAGGSVSATALYNVAGPRIHEAGIKPFADAYEQSRHLLDASLQLPLFRGATLKLDARNLLDSPYRLIQGTVERLAYRAGRTFSAGISWKP